VALTVTKLPVLAVFVYDDEDRRLFGNGVATMTTTMSMGTIRHLVSHRTCRQEPEVLGIGVKGITSDLCLRRQEKHLDFGRGKRNSCETARLLETE